MTCQSCAKLKAEVARLNAAYQRLESESQEHGDALKAELAEARKDSAYWEASSFNARQSACVAVGKFEIENLKLTQERDSLRNRRDILVSENDTLRKRMMQGDCPSCAWKQERDSLRKRVEELEKSGDKDLRQVGQAAIDRICDDAHVVRKAEAECDSLRVELAEARKQSEDAESAAGHNHADHLLMMQERDSALKARDEAINKTHLDAQNILDLVANVRMARERGDEALAREARLRGIFLNRIEMGSCESCKSGDKPWVGKDGNWSYWYHSCGDDGVLCTNSEWHSFLHVLSSPSPDWLAVVKAEAEKVAWDKGVAFAIDVIEDGHFIHGESSEAVYAREVVKAIRREAKDARGEGA